MKTKTDTFSAVSIAATEARGREILAANETGFGKEQREYAERNSLEAHHESAQADSANTPAAHLDAARAHLRVKDRFKGIAKYHEANSDKTVANACNEKAQQHADAAKKHVQAALGCMA